MATIEELLNEDNDEQSALRQNKLDDMLAHLRAIVNVDKRLMFNEDGTYKSPTEWPDDFNKAIRNIRAARAKDKNGNPVYDVQFHDQQSALKLLVQYEGLLDEGEKTETPFDALFARLPRDKLLELRDGLKHMARVLADDAKAKAESNAPPA